MTEQLTIRTAGAADYAAVNRLMEQCQQLHIQWRPDLYRDCVPMLTEAYYQEMIANETLLLAEREGCVLGMLYYQLRHTEVPVLVSRDTIYVDSLVVEESCRGQGIGTALLAHLRTLAEAKNVAAIELHVSQQNTSAQKMYASAGFRPKTLTMELPISVC